MKIAFIVNSVGDSDLALKTINALEQKGKHESVIISLTKAAQQRVENFRTKSQVSIITLPSILQSKSDEFPESGVTEQQLDAIKQYTQKLHINYAFIGIPSVNNTLPFQIATQLDTPVLMAYEFMFKPVKHSLWDHLPALSKKSNVKWALPLATAKEDFEVQEDKIYFTGHLSIDNAYAATSMSSKNPKAILDALHIEPKQSLAFVSSTTQPLEVDTDFLNCLLTELKNHPTIQVRLGLHPGIQDLDTYLQTILTIYEKHPLISKQFKIILPDDIAKRLKTPELTMNKPLYANAFIKATISGSEAASVADRIAQAVPGALLNQAILEGKPAYSHLGKPYLPAKYFSKSIASFFTGKQQPAPSKKDLGLENTTTPEIYAQIMTS
ncbi:hypothetical protein [Legionella waltersii]|uniref:Uncharacterized protein n=1 Tax=Legionella waltersii TaxID=66969 RepID=A0A0W1A0T3_9GAMM|nr:hypothetical protein [Legionella waltersii]KTD74959.1 hypothetical protein Lwal_3000 [Legionella waltersii]SNV08478.1 Uncharacterised protein [Legionella waltersii]